MSWAQWPGAAVQQPQVVAAPTPLLNPAPAVIPPGIPYSSDQWTQMQQQNWQQWAQWQQQYQQWHQQYGAEYQKSISAMANQQAVVPTVGVPPPLPIDPQQPPLPKEEGPKPAPPLPVPVPPPQQAALPQYSTQPLVPNQFSAPPPSFSTNVAPTPWKANSNVDQKRPLPGKEDSTAKRQMTNRQGWQTTAPIQTTPNQNEELSEAEKKFDKQFAEWEAQFNKWKDQNSGHPDKQQYKEYEKKWEQWRQQLLDRREAMRRKRLGLPPLKSSQAQNFNVPPPSQNSGVQQPPTTPAQPFSSSSAPTPKNVVSQTSSMFTKPPPDMNNEPLQFKDNDKKDEPQEDGLGFLNTSKSEGIPGLDLVKDGDIIEEEEQMPVHKGPDLEAISKGINNILGDQKLMSMLSMVSQNTAASLNNFPKVGGDATSSRDQSNMSVDDVRNEHPEPIQNFDDQTRSSFTMQPNDSEYFRGPMNNTPQFSRGVPPPNFYENESPYSRPPPNFAKLTDDDMRRPPPRFGNESDKSSFPTKNVGSFDQAPPKRQNDFVRGPGLLPTPDRKSIFGPGETPRDSFGSANMNKGREPFGPGKGDFDKDPDMNRNNFGPRGRPDFDQEGLNKGGFGGRPNFNQEGPQKAGFGGRDFDQDSTNKGGFGGRPNFNQEGPHKAGFGGRDFDQDSTNKGGFGGRPSFGRDLPSRNSFGKLYNDSGFDDERDDQFDNAPGYGRGEEIPPQNQRFTPNFIGGRDDFNEPTPTNFRGGRDVNEAPQMNFRGGRDINEAPPPNFRGRNVNDAPPPNFRGGNVKDAPPPNFRGGRDVNEAPPPNFRGGRDVYNEAPPPNFRGGRDVNEAPHPNFRGGRDVNDAPPPNFRGGRDDFNEYNTPPNFRGNSDDFSGPPPPSFRGGRNNFNEPPPPNFKGRNNDFRQNDRSFQRGGNFGPDFDGYDEREQSFGDGFNRSAQGNMGPVGFEEEGDYPPPPSIAGFGRNDSVEEAPEPPQFTRGQFEGEGHFDHMPPSDYLESEPIEDDIWKPVTVVDYQHKPIKPPEVDVLVEPFRMFDYRHKPLRRIPYPDRPNWLSDSVKMIPEFDPPIIRPPPIDRRMYDNCYDPMTSRREDRDRYRFDERHKYERKGHDSRFSPPPSVKYEEDDWPSRRRRSRSPRFERSPVGVDRDRNWDQSGRQGDRDRRGGNRRWEEEDRFKGERNFDRERRDDRRDRRDEDGWKRKESEWEGKRKWRNDDMDLDDDDRDTKEARFRMDNNKTTERDNFKDATPVFPFSKPIDQTKPTNITLIDDILNAPGRLSRPQRIVIILRGPPGSGKTHLAKMIKDKEVENGGSAPRILSLDDYFMIEQEREVVEEGKKVKLKEMVYEFEAGMEESYKNSLLRSFKKTITDGYFPFIIVDNVNDKVKYFGEMWSFAKQNGFQVYICQLELDIQTCTKRNIHNRTEDEIRRCIEGWETTPSHHPILDATTLLQGEPIHEVEMEEISSLLSDVEDKEDGLEDQLDRSKWDNFDCSINNLARLDGVSKPPRPSRTMEEFLQLDDEWEVTRPTKPGQKRVRWADLEERKQQEKMRAIGFVVGQTDWDRMMDPSMGQSALTQTKYIEKVQRRRF